MSYHLNFRSSLLKFCNERINDLIYRDLLNSGAAFVDFDAHAQMTSVPEVDILGTANLTWNLADKMFDLDVMFGVSTLRDTNMFRHHRVLDFLVDYLAPEKQIPVVDADTGADRGWMVVTNGTQLLPVMKTDTRSLQFLQVGLQTSVTYRAFPE